MLLHGCSFLNLNGRVDETIHKIQNFFGFFLVLNNSWLVIISLRGIYIAGGDRRFAALDG